MGAAALQFSMNDPRITSTLVGVSRPESVAQTLGWMSADIRDEFWSDIAKIGYSTVDPEANRIYQPG
jgi:D-threo-aldose 1-dehydrogenase